MKFIINETGEHKEIEWLNDLGVEMTPSIITGEDVVFDEEAGAFRITAERFDWWNAYIEQAKADDAEFKDLCNIYGDAALEILASHVDSVESFDVDAHHRINQEAFSEIRARLMPLSEIRADSPDEAIDYMTAEYKRRTAASEKTPDTSETREMSEEERKEYGAKKAAERQELYNVMDDTTAAAVGDPEKMGVLLDVAATFRNIGIGNLVLIAAQRPDAKELRTYDEWLRIGNPVKKGAAAVKLFAAGRDYETADGAVRKSYSDVKNYFDISDTVHSRSAIKEEPTPEYQTLLKAIVSALPQSIKPEDDMAMDAHYEEETKTIHVQKGQTVPLMIRGIVREAAMADLLPEYGDRINAELPSYAAAYIVCRNNRISTSGLELPTFRLEGMPVKDVRDILSDARAAATSIEQTIARGLKRLNTQQRSSASLHATSHGDKHEER